MQHVKCNAVHCSVGAHRIFSDGLNNYCCVCYRTLSSCPKLTFVRMCQDWQIWAERCWKGTTTRDLKLLTGRRILNYLRTLQKIICCHRLFNLTILCKLPFFQLLIKLRCMSSYWGRAITDSINTFYLCNNKYKVCRLMKHTSKAHCLCCGLWSKIGDLTYLMVSCLIWRLWDGMQWSCSAWFSPLDPVVCPCIQFLQDWRWTNRVSHSFCNQTNKNFK